MRRNVRKRTFGHVRPAKIEIRLRIRSVGSESSLAVILIFSAARIFHVDSEALRKQTYSSILNILPPKN